MSNAVHKTSSTCTAELHYCIIENELFAGLNGGWLSTNSAQNLNCNLV